MSEFAILTDSACDITPSLLSEWGVGVMNLSFAFENGETDENMTITEFYNRMRAGQVAKTSAINPDAFTKAFEDVLKTGSDVLYLAFSSGLSTTCNSARIAAEELAADYPDRKIAVVDSLCASAGQGLFVYLVSHKREDCPSLEELAEYAENLKLKICHWFTVDDLVYLKRGGRVSPAVAFVGSVLGIKPVMHVDNDGHLVGVSKARGRRAAIAALANKYEELAENPSGGEVFICHGDCLADANTLAEMLREKWNITVRVIADIGPVIGAHSGPGTLAVFFVGKER